MVDTCERMFRNQSRPSSCSCCKEIKPEVVSPRAGSSFAAKVKGAVVARQVQKRMESKYFKSDFRGLRCRSFQTNRGQCSSRWIQNYIAGVYLHHVKTSKRCLTL
jgi:hypothetical protein